MHRPFLETLKILAVSGVFLLGIALILQAAGDIVASGRGLLTGDNRAIWFALALLLYGFVHLGRALRLAVIVSGESVSLSKVATIHFYTSGTALFLPFKTSELFKFIELSRLMRSPGTAFVTCLIERVFDIGFLGMMFLASALRGDGGIGGGMVGMIWWAAVLVVVVAFVVLPPALSQSILFLMKRYKTKWSVRTIWSLHTLKNALAKGPQMLYGPKLSLICLLTGAIWTLEILVVLACGLGLDFHIGDFLTVFDLRLNSALDAVGYRDPSADGASPVIQLMRDRSGVVIGIGLAVAGLAGFGVALSLQGRELWRVFQSAVRARRWA